MGLLGIVEARPRGLDAPGDHLEAVALAHDAPAEGVGELQDGLDLVLDHPAHRDAGPVGHDGGHGLGVDAGQDQRGVALRLGELRLELAQLGRAAPRARPAPWPRSRRGAGGAARGSGRPARAPRPSAARGRPAAPSRSRAAPPASARREPISKPAASSRPMMSSSVSQRLDPPARVLDLGRRGVLAHRHARARGVEQAHRLVGELTRRDVAVRELDRRVERLVQELHAVVLLERRGDARAA